jgi:FixJ family two-component response regulator
MPEAPLVAVVDDDPSILSATHHLLKAAGFLAATFESAESFLTSPLHRVAACLVADMRMAGMSGIELHRQLAAAGRVVPTVIITASMDDVMRLRPQDAGIACYLRKPFPAEDLLACVRSALAKPAGSGRYP